MSSPVITELETVVMDSIAKLMTLLKQFLSEGNGGGIVQSTASEVIVTAMVAARESFACRFVLGTCTLDAKPAVIAGTPFEVIPVPREEGFSATAAALRRKIQEVMDRGLVSFYCTVTFGSASTRVVDDFAGIAGVAEEFPDAWVHIDAAYAGSAFVCPEYLHLFSPLLSFHSFGLNLHKWHFYTGTTLPFFLSGAINLLTRIGRPHAPNSSTAS